MPSSHEARRVSVSVTARWTLSLSRFSLPRSSCTTPHLGTNRSPQLRVYCNSDTVCTLLERTNSNMSASQIFKVSSPFDWIYSRCPLRAVFGVWGHNNYELPTESCSYRRHIAVYPYMRCKPPVHSSRSISDNHFNLHILLKSCYRITLYHYVHVFSATHSPLFAPIGTAKASR